MRAVKITIGYKRAASSFCAATAALFALSGCGGDEPSLPDGLTYTNATARDPCQMITPSLVENMVGKAASQKKTTPAPVEPSTAANISGKIVECNWSNSDQVTDISKRRSLTIGVNTQTVKPKSGDPYNGAKAAYSGATAGRVCQKPNIAAADACWYENSGLWVVVRKGHLVASVTASGSSADLNPENIRATADRIAGDVASKLPQEK